MHFRAKRAARQRPRRCAATDPLRLSAANVSPVTGLSTDYLNHFGEAIMLLDLAPQAPEYRSELNRWRPQTYREYFAASQLGHRHLSIAAYENADTLARREFDTLCTRMNALILTARSALREDFPVGPSPTIAKVVAELKCLFARASAAVHGIEAEDSVPPVSRAVSSARRRVAAPS